MTAFPQLQIPNDWPEDLPYLANLRQRMPLSQEDWDQICDWLRRTSFNEQNSLAGEVAGVLIRDFAPRDVRQRAAALLSQGEYPARLKSVLETRPIS